VDPLPLERFARHLARKRAARSTRYAYLATARRFLAGTTRPLDAITGEEVAAYLAARRAAGADWRRERTHLRAFFAALVADGALARAPTDGLAFPARRAVPGRTLAEGAVRDLLRAVLPEDPAPLDLRDLAALELLYAVALRAAEVCAVRVTDLDLAQGTLRVRPVKRGRPRVLGLPPKALPALQRYQARGRPRLLDRRDADRSGARLLLTKNGRPLDPSALRRLVRRRAARVGLDAYPHAIRRSAATHLLRAGASVRAIQLLLGHRGLDVTHAYLALDRHDLRRAVDALDLG